MMCVLLRPHVAPRHCSAIVAATALMQLLRCECAGWPIAASLRRDV
jgi:hypothetical protein